MIRSNLIEADLTRSIIGAFFAVYNTIGHGFLERIYVRALERELLSRGHCVHREVGFRVVCKGVDVGVQRIDMLVDDKVIVELKSTEVLPKAASRQLYNYLRATQREVGLLFHFGPDPGFRRILCRNNRP